MGRRISGRCADALSQAPTCQARRVEVCGWPSGSTLASRVRSRLPAMRLVIESRQMSDGCDWRG
eukprot:scaffold137738_cov29-Tisochrysis_lutea.AAC.3